MSEEVLTEGAPYEEAAAPVYVDPVEDAVERLRERFPEVGPDERPNFGGYVVPAHQLRNVATFVRDELGFNYLSSVTGLDLIDDGKMEVVYHTYSIDKGGGALVLKV